MFVKSLFCVSIILSISSLVFAQEKKYWISFKDKDIEKYDYRVHLSKNAIQKRTLRNIPLMQESDVPVRSVYLKTLAEKGVEALVTSKWLNAVSAHLSLEQVKELSQLNFITTIHPIERSLQVCKVPDFPVDTKRLGKTIRQMEADVFAELGLNGEGIAIGVIDAGFYNAHENKLLEKLFDENRIVEIKDFVNPSKTAHYSEKETGLDGHGSSVLEKITGEDQRSQVGMATEATFYLARTDHGYKEWRGEEDYWIAAMERMDSLGVRLINTSLGYALGFDEPSENYTPEEMDGETSAIASACKIATSEKGMFIVVSAGNEGGISDWKIVSTPGDAQGVVSVGSTNSDGMKMGYSSIGPDFLSYLKPNVSCFAIGGTSFAAPAVTGFVACLMQYKPSATSAELFEILERSGHLYPYGNNYIGYGIPKASEAIKLLDGKKTERVVEVREVRKQNVLKLEVLTQEDPIIIFHKKNKTIVLEQEKMEKLKPTISIKKPRGTTRSTVVFNNKIIEVIW